MKIYKRATTLSTAKYNGDNKWCLTDCFGLAQLFTVCVPINVGSGCAPKWCGWEEGASCPCLMMGMSAVAVEYCRSQHKWNVNNAIIGCIVSLNGSKLCEWYSKVWQTDSNKNYNYTRGTTIKISFAKSSRLWCLLNINYLINSYFDLDVYRKAHP